MRGSTSAEDPGPVLVRWLDATATAAEVGGKGLGLARLTAAGLPVPAGFCLTTAAFARWRSDGEPDAVPEPVAAALRQAHRDLAVDVVAVRSSATTEDRAGASAAGQQDTVLGVRDQDALLAAVLTCWRSLRGVRAVAYRAHRGLAEDGGAMAVVVQRQVDADAAGVAFSLDPVHGDRSAVVLEAVPGLGEALVAGTAAAEEIRVDRATGAVTPPVPVLLTAAEARRLAALVRRVEEVLDGDVDVEWCRADGELSLVQARPVTAAAPADPWNDSLGGDFLWTSTNVGEAIPDVMTPATWSMVQVFLRDAMATASIPPHVGWGRIGGRVYLNVSVMATLSRVVGVGEQRYRRLTAEVFGRLPPELEIPPVPVRRLAVLAAVVPMALHVLGEARRDARRLDGYLADHHARCERRHAEIAAVLEPGALGRLWTAVLEPEFHRVSWMLSAATRSSGASFVTTRYRLQRLVGDADANLLTAATGGRAGPLASLGLLDGLDALARGEIDAATFARRYGHRGPHEFELRWPRPAEDPDWLAGQLAARAGDPTHRDRLRAQREARDAAWQRLRAAHPVRARLLGRALTRWGRIARDRERARSEVIRYFGVLRAFTLRAGELTGLGDDVFFLELPELLRALAGEPPAARLAAGRRAVHAAYSALPPYPGLIRGRFDPFRWAADPDRRADLFLPSPRPEPVGGPADVAVRGFPGSAGVVEGPVRVLTDPDRADALRPGEVLVTPVTNVGWTPYFPRAAAVVTDVGAPLSHAAIVARELGIPAVVGCGNATTLLRTGDRVRVDGAAGTVERLGPDRAVSPGSS
ncbi:pyruvate, water dikinase [Friedmanniella luteola]|uniref:Pyruvate, water dikinase n=1 Tax=Friedmanniella luteola TaxID=546871 RepID=A0A1H1ZYF2_9ACTN|nr:PEP/pyruvate-binding domain-containing protein [Friedmanniella luteola]SDT38442.1 pyruvate, water dikinase [Friedmanniella luteola]